MSLDHTQLQGSKLFELGLPEVCIVCNIYAVAMTKNQIKKRSSRSNKEHPGCMGSILHLFDFPSGKKLLTDKTHGDGAETRRISLDASNDFVEIPKPMDAKNEYGLLYDSKKSPATKNKAGGLPMKALIAEEMSKELEAKRRTPSVIARLMGLDTFPAEAMLAENIQESDNEPQKITSGKHQQQPKPSYDAGISPQKSRASVCKEISFPKSLQKAPNHRKQRAPSSDQPQGKHMYEFKNEFEASQGSTCHDHSKNEQMDELGVHLVEKQMLVHEMLDEAKMAFVRQKFIDAKHLATDETLQQSEEFLDALGVLKSNKDLFLKFLQEPNSLFAKHLEDLHSASQMASEAKNVPKMKSSNVMAAHEVLKKENISQGSYSKEGKKPDKLLQKQKGRRFLTGRDEEWRVRSSKDQCNQYSGAGTPVKSDSCSLPTRIVVLKPGPGSAQNARPTSPPSYSQSQTAFKSLGEGERANTRNFLEEVRERLKMGLKETRKDDSKYTQESVRSRIHDGPKDPREIAREIARQVRESVTRDLTKDHSRLGEVSTSFSSFNGKKNSLNVSRDSSGELGICRDIDISTPVIKHSLDYTKRSGGTPSYPVSKSPNSSESTVNKEAKKRLSERVRLTHLNEEEQQSRGNSSTLGKMLALREDEKPVCQLKSSRNNNKTNYGAEENQLQVRHESDTDCEDHGGEDENGNIPSKSLLSSPSIPVSSMDFDRESVEMQSRISDVSTGQAHEIVSDKSSFNLPTELYKIKNNESVFKGNDSSLEESILLRGRRSTSRNSDSLMQPDASVQMTLDEGCDALSAVLDVLEHQETYKQSTNAHHMENEPLQLSEGIISETLTADSKDTEETALEPLDWDPASVQSDALQFGDNADYATEGIPSEQAPPSSPSSPTSCSPPNQLPHPESGASEVNNEKAEQPSPVSVLDSPFQEETPSPKGFKEISSNLQELRLRLRLLKFDGSEKPMHKAENVLQANGIDFDDHYSGETEFFSERTCNSPSEAAISPPSRLQSSTLIENVDFESVELDGIGCPEDKQLDLLYVKNVLVASGFTGDKAFSRWYLPNNPLDPSLFEKIENHCGYGSELGKSEANGSKWERHLLFDCINEVLLEILGPFFNHHPWVRNTKLNLRNRPVGKQLLRETWAAISYYLYTQSENCNTLENIVAKDLAKEGEWMQLQNYVEIIGCELERAIYNDLIEEAIFDLVP